MAPKQQEERGEPPPPLVYLAALLIGIGIDFLWPLSTGSGRWQSAVGTLCIVAGLITVFAVLACFHRARTTFDPRKVASTLVTRGPFRCSRHPAYVALTLIYLGLALLLDNGWVVLLAAPVLFVMDRWIVRMEERRLELKFGDEYRRYEASVRRWL